MTKYTEEQISVHKKHLTVLDMADIAKRHGKHPHTLRNILTGVFSYEGGDEKRQAMIHEATELVKQRVMNDMDVISEKV